MTEKQSHRHVTLIEMLMIVSLIAVVISLGIVFFDPIGRSAVSRNAERWNHVNTLASALAEYAQEHEGKLPVGIDEREKEICVAERPPSACLDADVVDLSLLVPEYLRELPVDQRSPHAQKSGYTVQFLPQGRLYVAARYAENGDTIAISR